MAGVVEGSPEAGADDASQLGSETEAHRRDFAEPGEWPHDRKPDEFWEGVDSGAAARLPDPFRARLQIGDLEDPPQYQGAGVEVVGQEKRADSKSKPVGQGWIR